MTAVVSVPLHSETTTAVTVSGTITGPGGVVADVIMMVGTPLDWQETTSNAAGFYSVTVQTDGPLWIHVRPPLASGLAQVNQRFESVSSSFTQNFTLQAGHLLDVTITAGGQSVSTPLPLEITPLQAVMPEGNWYQLDWQGSSHNYQAVLPPDIYYVFAYNPPDGYFDTTAAYDLRTTGETAVLPLNTQYVHPIPKTPPDASKITIGAVDSLGEATITGAAGAALPLARVLLVNLNSTHQSHTISAADGSFTAQLYAPPGSAVMVKHGPASERWRALDAGVSEMINPFPGTIINVPPAGSIVGTELPFAAVGAVDNSIDDTESTPNYVGAAWALASGRASGMALAKA